MTRVPESAVRRTIADVSRRWLHVRRGLLAARVAFGVAAIWLAAWLAAQAAARQPFGAAIAFCAALVASVAWASWQVRRRPSPPPPDRIARLIEERFPDLDDRLVTAVHVWPRVEHGEAFALRLLADADRAVAAVSADDVIPAAALRRSTMRAVLSAAVCLVAAILWMGPGQRALQVLALHLFPGRYPLVVSPGDARVKPGEPLAINAAVVTPFGRIVPNLHVRVGDDARSVAMRESEADRYAWRFETVPASFSYHVSAGGRRSDAYRVTLLQQPRVRRIDLHYQFPSYTRLAPRIDEDGGDIYAPAGTRVRVSVLGSKPLVSGALVLASGERIPLRPADDDRVETELTVHADGAYRVALGDGDGLSSTGDTEYFIRVLNDRPPTVRIVRPARDRQVTLLEEVTIEARADDDYGIERLELVYSVRGGREMVAPLGRADGLATVTGRRTLFLEELDVEPGDFVTYYARARDIGRGKAASESRSDIFFLEVAPFEEEFAAAQTQAASAAGGGTAVDGLVAAQKDIIVATWKLERRSHAGRSKADIQAVGRAQGELKTRAAAAAQMLSRGSRRRAGPLGALTEGAGAEAPPMMRAVDAMGRAEEKLTAGNTRQAIPPEMEALNHLLKAQAEIRRREVARQQAGSGAGGNRAEQDLSSLFDRELRRQQQTNYETPRTTEERREGPADDVMERVRELARRQEQLARQQEELLRERERLTAEEMRRRLERLARDQSELRRLAEQTAQQSSAASSSSSRQEQRGASAGSQLREASEEMRRAAGELRRDAPEEAQARSQRALDRLRALERSLAGEAPDEQRRALGDLQLEARQLAERQRRLAEQAAAAGTEGNASESRRKLAAEQGRVADRARRFEERVRELASGGGDKSRGEPPAASNAARSSAREAARELEQNRLAERMAGAARAFREDARSTNAAASSARESREMQDLARALEGVADRLEPEPAGGGAEQQRLSEELSATRRLRSDVRELGQRIDELQRGGSQGESGRSPGDQASGQGQSLDELRAEYSQRAREMERLEREAGGGAAAGGMSTPRGPRATPSAPGTEAFKQDFSRWESLHKDVTLRLERLEASLSQRLLEHAARERVRAGGDDRAPDTYDRAVDRYFRSLADPSASP